MRTRSAAAVAAPLLLWSFAGPAAVRAQQQGGASGAARRATPRRSISPATGCRT